MNRMGICKNCGHWIIEHNGVWFHCMLHGGCECPVDENTRGECGYTGKECRDKFIAPCDYYPPIALVNCAWGCKTPTPKNPLVRIVVYFKKVVKQLQHNQKVQKKV